MQSWLLKNLSRVVLSGLGNSQSAREIADNVNKVARRETGSDLSKGDMSNLIRRLQRRADLAEQLMDSGDAVPRPQNAPRCPENTRGEKTYHAVVYVDLQSGDGSRTTRTSITVPFSERLTANEIIDLAVADIEQGNRGQYAGERSSNPERADRTLRPTPINATVGSICYG